MKLLLKIGKLFVIMVLTVSILLLSASYLLRDKVGFIILRSLNKNLSTKLVVGSYKLSFLRKFPNASLELKDVLVHSSADFNKFEFKGINTDTLIAAKSVSVEFKLTDIIKGKYNIERISARSGKANFYTDYEGFVNYNVSVKSDNPDSRETTINLERINLNDIIAYYNNLDAHLILSGPVKSGRLKSRISGGNIDLSAISDLQITRFELYNYKSANPLTAKLDLVLKSTKEGITFKKSTMHIDDYDIVLEGFVSSKNYLDLKVEGHNIKVAGIEKFLPGNYLASLNDYHPAGIINVTSTIKGTLSKKLNPHIEIDWQLKSGKVISKKTDIAFRDISFTGHFSNGRSNNFETSTLSLNNLSAELGSSESKGSAVLRNLNTPLIDLSLKGRVYPAELKEFFNITSISKADGSVDLDMKIINSPWPEKNFSAGAFFDLRPQADMSFNSLTIGLQDGRTVISNISGKASLFNTLKTYNLHLTYKGQSFKIDGEFKNLPEWFLGRNVTLAAKGDVKADKFIPERFLSQPGSKSKSTAAEMPDDITLDINFKTDSLIYKTFTSSDAEAKLNYQPTTFSFNNLKMKALNGLISGDGFVAQNKDKSMVVKGNFNVKNVDVNRAFTTFNNFGQTFLKAENIRGALSGSLSLLLPLDPQFNFHIKNLTAEGKYHLVNGALINFDPVKQLSTFIEISELENITFDQLDNDFFIRNNMLFVPQMVVNSSAADLSVNGKHSFDNDYEYHVKILLSEILSRKRIKKKNNVEFGAIEDDGLGRTSLLLKIIGKGEEAKVSYDMKAAAVEVKQNFAKEKVNLKTILNEEYGWYKKDSAVTKKQEQKKPEEKKTRFKINWDDGDAGKSQ
jgi:hypothetical protein